MLSAILLCFTILVKSQVTFTDVTVTAGLKGGNGNNSIGDYNKDGYLDILIGGNRLFKNSGPPAYTFDSVGIGGAPAGGGVFGDYNNDGYPDILMNRHSGDTAFIVLYRNSGPPNYQFTDVSKAALLGYPILKSSLGIAMAWLDYDNDGYIDFYVCSYENPTSVGIPDNLFHNNRNGTFTDVSGGSGIASKSTVSRGINCADFDEDGDVDMYISVYRLQQNLLWRNNNNGTFIDVAAVKQVEGHNTSGYYGHTISSAWGDLNNDGLFDLFCANLAHKNTSNGSYCDDSYVFINNGPPNYTFTDIRSTSGIPVHAVGSSQSGFYYDELFDGVALGDYDNDGYLDLYITQVYDNIPFAYSFVYKNNGNKTFTNTTANVGTPRVWDAWGPVWFDYDNDGDLDILTYGSNVFPVTSHASRLYRNDNTIGNKWLEVDLKGKASNHSAIGAVVKIYTNSGKQIRQVEGGTGNFCQNPFRIHFGLGNSNVIDSLIIKWPSKTIDKLFNVSTNQIKQITEGEATGVDTYKYLIPSVVFTTSEEDGIFNLYNIKGNTNITIYDCMGRIVHTINSNRDTEKVNLSKLKSGIYLYKVENSNFSGTGKFVVI